MVPHKPVSPQYSELAALLPLPENNGTFSQLWVKAETDQNTNKEKLSGATEDCFV